MWAGHGWVTSNCFSPFLLLRYLTSNTWRRWRTICLMNSISMLTLNDWYRTKMSPSSVKQNSLLAGKLVSACECLLSARTGGSVARGHAWFGARLMQQTGGYRHGWERLNNTKTPQCALTYRDCIVVHRADMALHHKSLVAGRVRRSRETEAVKLLHHQCSEKG